MTPRGYGRNRYARTYGCIAGHSHPSAIGAAGCDQVWMARMRAFRTEAAILLGICSPDDAAYIGQVPQEIVDQARRTRDALQGVLAAETRITGDGARVKLV